MCIRDRSTQSTWGSKSNYSRKMVNSTPKRGLELNGLKLTVSGIFGALIGILTSVVVNSCLAEISINPFFSLVRENALFPKIIAVFRDSFYRNRNRHCVAYSHIKRTLHHFRQEGLLIPFRHLGNFTKHKRK
eukprot:TRINITY_DN3879_c0_g1_i11.p2 TRINITY_DN3879_c0_g1~~TRINITY_DN3879_c0_g1_i11.p2  ORF type:complete len:148 (+),score=21.30 TRINITY_DN3879_c0_g1_i11:49-444(+)